MAELQAGVYHHFKGKEYQVLGTAEHSETGEQVVVYRPLYGDYLLRVRPLAMFTEQVDRDGYQGPRFTFVRPIDENAGAFIHGDAYMLMKYETADGSEVEWVWNSRDGVTPFIISSRSGVEMRHVTWGLDRRLPTYKPSPGERIFVDLTEAKARQYAQERVERAWDDPQWPMRGWVPTKEEAVERIVADMLKQPGEPDLIYAREWQRGESNG